MSDLSTAGITNCHSPLHLKAVEGIELFNAGLFLKAHEALEAAWLDASGPIRNMYPGILQVAVITLHITRPTTLGRSKSILAVKSGYSPGLRFAKTWQSAK
jgi:predicted metal-dependent hydrolase